jgi:AraC family transcriptional regulator
MSLQTSHAQNTKNHVVGLRSIELPAVGQRRREQSKFADHPAEDSITLSLLHLDVALAVEAQDQNPGEADDGAYCFKVSAKRLARDVGNAAGLIAEKIEDPIIRRLSDALAATEAAHDHHSAICADALRLAILTRQFSRQDDFGQSATGPVSGASKDFSGRNVRSLQKWRLKRVLDYVDDHLSAKITLQNLAMVAGLSRMHFAAQFRAALGMRPHEYLLKRRIERAEELLKQAEVSLVDVALTVGFQTQAHFTTVFKRFAGDTPYQWRCAYLAQATPLPPAPRRLS